MLLLLKMTDEYLLPDLQKVCEQQIIDNLDGESAFFILTDTSITLPLETEQKIKEVSKSVFLDEYEKVEEIYPDIEERIARVKGLMSELFIHKKKQKKQHKKRKNSIIIGDDA